MTRLNWVFCNGSRWFQDFETQEQAIDYAHFCDLLRSHSVDKVWISSELIENQQLIIEKG